MNNKIQPQKEYDQELSRELVLWMDNTQELYNIKQSWVKNYSRKIEKGVFNIEEGIKGMKYLVKNTLDSYNKEFGSNLKIEKNDKRPIQIDFLENILADIWNNYDLRGQTEQLLKSLKGFF